MKRVVSLIAATAVLVLAASALAQTASAQGAPQAQSAARDPSMATPSGRVPDMATESSASTSAAAGSSGTSSRLASLAPAGMSLQDACRGLKSVSQCLSSLHVSQNLNIPFADLKSKMTSGESLGAAIRHLKPGADVNAETAKAAEQARLDIAAPQG